MGRKKGNYVDFTNEVIRILREADLIDKIEYKGRRLNSYTVLMTMGWKFLEKNCCDPLWRDKAFNSINETLHNNNIHNVQVFRPGDSSGKP